MLTLLVFLPLFGSIISGLFSNLLGKKGVIWAPTLLCAISLLLSIILLSDAITGDAYVVNLASWINSGTLSVNWALKLDMLSAIMLFVVMLVSTLVHLYSIGYMDHDPHQARFFSYLSFEQKPNYQVQIHLLLYRILVL